MSLVKSEDYPPPYRTQFASLSLHKYFLILMLRFPPDIVATIHTVILKDSSQGLCYQRPYYNSTEFKLWGEPMEVFNLLFFFTGGTSNVEPLYPNNQR